MTAHPTDEFIRAKIQKPTTAKKISLKARQTLLSQEAMKNLNISHKKQEIKTRMSKILNFPNEMRQLQDFIEDVKANKHKDICRTIQNNKFMAINYKTLERIKLKKLTVSLKENTKSVIRKREQIEQIKRERRIEMQQFWNNKRIENQKRDLQLKRQYRKIRRNRIWISLNTARTFVKMVSNNFKQRLDQIALNREVSLYTIKIVSKLMHKLKKKGPDWYERTVSLNRHSITSSVML